MTPKSLVLAAVAALILPGAACADQSGHSAAHPAATAEVKAGDLTLTGGFTRATLPGAPVAGGFVTIANAGASDDVLTGGSAAFAGDVQVHEMTMQGDVMKMRALPEGLTIPAGQTVELKPGSFHLMFMDLEAALKQGDTVEVTLDFARAGKVILPLTVLDPGAKSAGHTGHGG